MNDTDTPAAPAAPTPADLATEAAKLDARRARLDEVQAGLQATGDEFAARLNAVHVWYSETAGPLGREKNELLAAIRRSEEAADELTRRRERAERLRAELAAAEAELPTEP